MAATYYVASGLTNLANDSIPQGTYLSWNNSGGTGETDFINSRGGGPGGFYFYDVKSNETSTSSPIVQIDKNGNVTANSFNATSDYRIKNNVIQLDDTFVVDNLKPVIYNNLKTGDLDIGLIAHELQEFYPYLVKGTKNSENLQSVNYIGIIGILIKEVQTLKKIIKELKPSNEK